MRVCTPGRDNGGQTGSDYTPPLSKAAFVLQLPGPFAPSRGTGLTPCPGSLDPVLEGTNPVRSLCEFRRFCRVYAWRAASVNVARPSAWGYFFTGCLGFWRVLRCAGHCRMGRIPMSLRAYLILAFVLLFAVACGNGGGDTSGSEPQAGGQCRAPPPHPRASRRWTVTRRNRQPDIDRRSGRGSVVRGHDCAGQRRLFSGGSCIEGKFTVEIESESGGTLNVPANETTTAWSGRCNYWRGNRAVGPSARHPKCDRHRQGLLDHHFLSEVNRALHTLAP